MPTGGVRTSLASMVAMLTSPLRRSEARASDDTGTEAKPKSPIQADLTQFRSVFQPSGMFNPGYPLVPPESERPRLLDFPVGYNTVYTPRSFEPVSFTQLRANGRSPPGEMISPKRTVRSGPRN